MKHETRKNVFTSILINARSLRNKLDSLKFTLSELGADVCLLTETWFKEDVQINNLLCLLYTSPSPRDRQKSRMTSSA